VVAPDIAFDASDATPLHGRSAVIDPFGRIVAQCEAQGDGVAIADATEERVCEVRAKLPLTLWES
jgi:predicted amidohydrolase